MNPFRLAPWPLVAAAALFMPWAAAGTAPLDYVRQSVAVDGAVQEVRLPRGYVLEVLTTELDRPRLPAFAPNGDLFIGSGSGAVYRLPPPYNEPALLVRLPGYPHSVAFREGEILIARTDGLYRAPYEPGQARLEPGRVRLLAALPGGGGHSSRTVAVGPDGRVYASLGISGNCSDQYLGQGYGFDARRGGVVVLDESGGEARWEPFASGLRNPVGFDWQPGTGALYASNNGPDHWGYDQPPEVFSRLDPGSFHGMPWFQYDGKQVRRDDCIRRDPPRPLAEVAPPAATFPARNAPMGVAFVADDRLGADLEGDAVVALHGSWGTRPFGGYVGDPATRRPPALVLVRFANGAPIRVDDLVDGFQAESGARWARPVGVAHGPDGALYFTSDSGANALFRLRRAE
ncbi:MAG: PQQ-dependent sugar dehydrogenase [Gammaproteobacteria bacterium]|nr:PQQ-dependent sugar dehydrogenase [Gammaproteobacteria bacterium]